MTRHISRAIRLGLLPLRLTLPIWAFVDCQPAARDAPPTQQSDQTTLESTLRQPEVEAVPDIASVLLHAVSAADAFEELRKLGLPVERQQFHAAGDIQEGLRIVFATPLPAARLAQQFKTRACVTPENRGTSYLHQCRDGGDGFVQPFDLGIWNLAGVVASAGGVRARDISNETVTGVDAWLMPCPYSVGDPDDAKITRRLKKLGCVESPVFCCPVAASPARLAEALGCPDSFEVGDFGVHNMVQCK